MRSKRRTVLAALVAMLALSAMTASAAFAGPEWYAKKGGLFNRITSPLEVKSTTNITLTDTNWLELHLTAEAPCTGTISGTIEAGGLGKITSYTVSCSAPKSGSCGQVVSASALHLPWKTELYSEGGVTRERIVSGGAGTPQWSFTCKGEEVAEVCGFNTSAKVVPSGVGNVEALFEKSSAGTTCLYGGANAAHLAGVIATAHPEGVEAIQAAEGGQWRQGGTSLSEALGTTWKGTLKLTDTPANFAIECADSGKGTVGPGASGTQTGWTNSSCVTKHGFCPSPEVAAVRLPWQTELVVREGATQDLTTKGTGGTPGFQMICSGAVEDECTGTLAEAMENRTGGVNGTFDGEKLTCTLSRGSGKVEGTQLVEASKGGALEVS